MGEGNSLELESRLLPRIDQLLPSESGQSRDRADIGFLVQKWAYDDAFQRGNGRDDPLGFIAPRELAPTVVVAVCTKDDLRLDLGDPIDDARLSEVR